MITRRCFTQSAAAITGAVLMTGKSFSENANSARAQGYRLPEEADPHERTFMQWPVSLAVYRDRAYLESVQEAVADIANAVAAFEPVVMLMDERYESAARSRLSDAVEIWNIPTDDLWARDSGPIFVFNEAGNLAVSQTNFNGWGNKQIHVADGQIAARVAQHMGIPLFDNGLVGEGGGVESDGNGTLMAHESSWVNPNRNEGSRAEVTELLLEALGAEKMIWAPGILGADITDYHIDALARFVAPGEVVIQLGETVDHSDPWSKAAFETFDVLRAARDANGNALELTIVPDPRNIRVKSFDFVASYVNYYVCNGGVVTAHFGDASADAEAVSILSDLYPGRDVVSLDVDRIGEIGGGVHCATREQPKV